MENKIKLVLSNAVILTGAEYIKSGKFNPFYENTGKLNLVVSLQLKDQYAELSKWEKLFVANFYGKNNNNIILEKPSQKETKYEKVREDIQSELQKLYTIADDEEYFKITMENNKDLENKFNNELKALESDGQKSNAEYFLNSKQQILNEWAQEFAKHQQEQYKHIVDYIKNTSYEPAFQVLMLRETLLQTYKKTKDEEGTKTIVGKRVQHKTIIDHMTLNEDVLSTIYNNLDNYSSFTNLYFAGIAILNKTMSQKSGISLDGIDTFGKGKWLKFEGKQSNKEKYIQNAQALSALVQDTPWCTKQLAASQLEQGDFFVFVDNENKPHIAVKMTGNEIDEVRGIKNGNAQELEEDYRPVALEFLTKNKDIRHGKEWLEKEEWNKRLITWKKKIHNKKTFSDEEIKQMLYDAFQFKDYKAHSGNSNKEALKNSLPKIKNQIAKFYNCKESEICLEDYLTFYDKVCEFKVIFGYADFRSPLMTTLGNLQFIYGDAHFRTPNLTYLGNLQRIGGNAYFNDSQITNLGNLQSVGGNAHFRESQIKNLGNLQSIGGTAYFNNSQITNLGKLQRIGGNASFSFSQITDLSNLKIISGNADFQNSQITNLGNLQSIGGNAFFSDSQITSLGFLKNIRGYADFRNSQITDLGNLQSIGGDADFTQSQITCLGNLQNIGGDADFTQLQITCLGNLQRIGGSANFICSQITDLGNLKSIGGNANFKISRIANLGKLEVIGKNAKFDGSNLTDLGNLKIIGGDADFTYSEITNLSNLQNIGGDANFSFSQITDFGKLKEIGGEVRFGNSKHDLWLKEKFEKEFYKDEKTKKFIRRKEFLPQNDKSLYCEI